MKELLFDDALIANFKGMLESTTIKGIEMVGSDPGDRSDNILYIVSPNATLNTELYIRFNTAYYKIGEIVTGD